MTCHPFVIKKNKTKQHPSSPWTPTEHRFPSPHFFVGKLPINATLKFDDTALYICTSGSIVSEGRFAIDIQMLACKKTHPPAGAQLPKAPTNLAGLLEIEVYFSYLDRIGLLKFLFV